MKKFALGLALLLITSAVFAEDRATTPELTPPDNGVEWLRLSSTEKLFWAIGYSQGYREALDKIDVTAGPTSPCASLAIRTERQTSTSGKLSGFELVSSLERFYAEPANTVIPIGSAIRISLLQASGKDQTTIQELIDTARVLGQQAAARPRP
ncbi:MAG TPA: hypothetical protein VND45_07745 [Thermoanaerobaculia bacterium]|jgi:hypothetical protein|nr:hypothetical protein [Thermoanaerobaculia bacterium]